MRLAASRAVEEAAAKAHIDDDHALERARAELGVVTSRSNTGGMQEGARDCRYDRSPSLDDEAKRVLAPGYKDNRQALIYPLFYVLLATKDIARSVRPRVSK